MLGILFEEDKHLPFYVCSAFGAAAGLFFFILAFTMNKRHVRLQGQGEATRLPANRVPTRGAEPALLSGVPSPPRPATKEELRALGAWLGDLMVKRG